MNTIQLLAVRTRLHETYPAALCLIAAGSRREASYLLLAGDAAVAAPVLGRPLLDGRLRLPAAELDLVVQALVAVGQQVVVADLVRGEYQVVRSAGRNGSTCGCLAIT